MGGAPSGALPDELVRELVQPLDRAFPGRPGGGLHPLAAVVVRPVDDLDGRVAQPHDVCGTLGGRGALVSYSGLSAVSQTPGLTDTAVTRGSAAKTVSASCDCA